MMLPNLAAVHVMAEIFDHEAVPTIHGEWQTQRVIKGTVFAMALGTSGVQISGNVKKLEDTNHNGTET